MKNTIYLQDLKVTPILHSSFFIKGEAVLFVILFPIDEVAG